MSVLFAGLAPDVAAALTARLLDAGDQVRAIAASGAEVPAGVHVATGELDDEDLVERACQGVRTIVLGEVASEVRAAALVAAKQAGVERVVLVGAPAGVPPGMSWVALVPPRSRLLGRRKPVTPDDLAEAIDAADDLAGEPRLVADLGTVEGWSSLRLEPRT